MTTDMLADVQHALVSLGLPGWLLYSFRDSNPLACSTVGIGPHIHVSRRWACYIPQSGEPRSLIHVIEPHLADHLPGATTYYSSYDDFLNGLNDILHGVRAVAMEYSPYNAVPVVGRVDAGTVELVRSMGPQVVSSGDLVAWLTARLSPEQLASAKRAGLLVRDVVFDAFRHIRDAVLAEEAISEFSVQQFIMQEFERRGLTSDHDPIVATNAHSADPHYSPAGDRSTAIGRDDFVLIDLWAREVGTSSVYGDITWTGVVADSVPREYAEIFAIVAAARDAAFDLVTQSSGFPNALTGGDVDTAARTVITNAGYGPHFVHRTGHSITWELHGAGVNMDHYETHDTRRIVPSTSFSIEPGIYLPGRFGIRSEIDVVIDADGGVHATSEPRQHEVVSIMRVI